METLGWGQGFMGEGSRVPGGGDRVGKHTEGVGWGRKAPHGLQRYDGKGRDEPGPAGEAPKGGTFRTGSVSGVIEASIPATIS